MEHRYIILNLFLNINSSKIEELYNDLYDSCDCYDSGVEEHYAWLDEINLKPYGIVNAPTVQMYTSEIDAAYSLFEGLQADAA